MPLPEVRGGIAISGIYDLGPIRLNYLNEKLGLDTAEAERNSPVRHLPATAGALVVAYGSRELPELCRQSIEYARAWTERGLPGRLLPVDGADHFTILDALARPEGVLTRALLAMLGRFEGRNAIRNFFRGASGIFSFAIHYSLNGHIEVDGDTARARWYLFMPCTVAAGNQAMWRAGIDHETYARVAGIWMFRHKRSEPLMSVPFETGWATARFV